MKDSINRVNRRRDRELEVYGLTVSINIGSLIGVGEYSFADPSNNAVFTVYKYNTGNYSSSNTRKGKVAITKDDRANTILSGTFEFDGVDINHGYVPQQALETYSVADLRGV